jgi:hypothetical protein
MALIQLPHPLSDIGPFELHRSAKNELPASFSPGKQFVRVHIRIETPSYRQQGVLGWQTPEDNDYFQAEIGKILSKAKMIVDGSRASTQGEYPEDLYIHPDDLSGMISIHRLADIVSLLDQCPTSKLRWIDIYDFPEGLDADEKLRRLRHYEPELIRTLIEKHNTGKKSAFRHVPVFSDRGVASGFAGLQFVENFSRGMTGCPVGNQYMEELMVGLMKDGILHMGEQDGHRFYRTALKGELKAVPKADRGDSWRIAEEVLWAS